MSQYHVVEPGAFHTGAEEDKRWTPFDPNAEHSVMDRIGISNKKGKLSNETLLSFDAMNVR